MKKNKLFIIGLVTVFVALLSLTLVSSTFAKYVTTGTGSASARVAKWGFKEVTMNLENELFKNVYLTGTSETGTSENVKSGAKVIAPGTEGSASFGFTYDKTGTVAAPEVAYTLTVSTEGSDIADEIKNNTNIKWKLDNGEFGTWDKLLAAIKALSGDTNGTKSYAAGELPTLNTDGKFMHTVKWIWEFGGNDAADTSMGNAADLASVKLKITVTATQID